MEHWVVRVCTGKAITYFTSKTKQLVGKNIWKIKIQRKEPDVFMHLKTPTLSTKTADTYNCKKIKEFSLQIRYLLSLL